MAVFFFYTILVYHRSNKNDFCWMLNKVHTFHYKTITKKFTFFWFWTQLNTFNISKTLKTPLLWICAISQEMVGIEFGRLATRKPLKLTTKVSVQYGSHNIYTVYTHKQSFRCQKRCFKCNYRNAVCFPKMTLSHCTWERRKCLILHQRVWWCC